MNKSESVQLLRENLSPVMEKIHCSLLEEWDLAFNDWSKDQKHIESISKESWDCLQWVRFLSEQVNTQLERINELKNDIKIFESHYHNAANPSDRTQAILAIAKTLNYSSKAITKIRMNKAKWIDASAIYDRYVFVVSDLEKCVVFALERISIIITNHLADLSVEFHSHFWRLVQIEQLIEYPIKYTENHHVFSSSLKCLRRSMVLLTQSERIISPTLTQYIYRIALDKTVDFWVRSEAIAIIAILDREQFKWVVRSIFDSKDEQNIFFQGRIIRYICQFHGDSLELQQELIAFTEHPSEFLRQRLAEYSVDLPPTFALKVLNLLIENGTCRVRAQCYLSLVTCFEKNYLLQSDLLILINDRITEECKNGVQSIYALRVLIETFPSYLTLLKATHQKAESAFLHFEERLSEIHLSHPSTPVRRWCAETRELLWFTHQSFDNLTSPLNELGRLPLQDALTYSLADRADSESFYRYIANVGRSRFGFDVSEKKQRYSFISGFKYRFRFWRFIHEFRNPATDKRQSHNHMRGRVYRGLTQLMSNKMAEMSATKVPGEPLYSHDEKGAKSYLPLLDQILSSLDQGWPTQPMRLYSSEGITEIFPPKSFVARVKARVAIQMKFSELASLRDWKEGDSNEPNEFLTALTQLGFTVKIHGHKSSKGNRYEVDSRVQRHFPSFLLPFSLPSFSDMQNYFYSVYQNTIQQLLGFTFVVVSVFFAMQATAIIRLRNARKNIPVVIGGWGTRGKSGTERLKAALFNALGFSVFSKTTGCEAMFLHGPPNKTMKELFLFRPYDKATIWEQVFLTKLASKLNVDVFLWECMGLTPRYIDILQNQWMRDDISTITNCYPDHEDLQGPAGIDIPIVMKRFVPKDSHLITSEDSMLPLLEDAAYEKNTQFSEVTWRDAWLITEDVIERFPYEEHPNNIALVLRLAQELGISKDFALYAMANNVIPDLGVLKIYPEVQVSKRRIEFINGMSANERLATLENWKRTGMDEHSLSKEPNIWTGVVINNRADRVARSQVFASIMVNDIQVDSYFLIGDNLAGFEQYLEIAWEKYIDKLAPSIISKGSHISTQEDAKAEPKLSAENQSAVDALHSLLSKFRIPTTEGELLTRMKLILKGAGVPTDKLHAFIETLPNNIIEGNVDDINFSGVEEQLKAFRFLEKQLKRSFSELHRAHYFVNLCSSGAMSSDKYKEMCEWLFQSYKSRWTVIQNYHAKGNQVLDEIINEIPPGLKSRIMGVQNIKGTGLDFIYRWQAWDKVYQNCQVLHLSNKIHEIEDAVKSLVSWEEFGLLDKAFVLETVKVAAKRNELQINTIQANLNLIEKRMKHQIEIVEQSLGTSHDSSKLITKFILFLERVYDSGEAIKRRRRSDKIYNALVDNLISYDRATIELAQLTKAQKGGWLLDRIKSRIGL